MGSLLLRYVDVASGIEMKGSRRHLKVQEFNEHHSTAKPISCGVPGGKCQEKKGETNFWETQSDAQPEQPHNHTEAVGPLMRAVGFCRPVISRIVT